jgi:thioesterase domain-containing protein/acyl carrier protein
VARGYLNRADLTAETFIPNAFSGEPGERLYKTGDLARYLPDGSIELFDRIDRQVKIRGFRIELEEIEKVLRQHLAVRDAVVVVHTSATEDKQLIGYVAVQKKSTLVASELRDFLKEKLPGYMVPAVFVLLDALPLMASGKVDRSALPDPRPTMSQTGGTVVAPRNPLEREISELWEEVLSIRPVGVTANFFELGGHSLAAVRLFALIEKRLGKKVPLATLFQGPTVEHLAKIIEQAEVPPHSSLVAIRTGGSRLPIFLIHPAGGHVFPYVQLANCLGPDQPCYGLQAKGLDPGQESHQRIDEMAAYYISAIQTVQARGPYLLGGWSMGGVVAFEMAQQLRSRGERTAFLALLDTRISADDEEFADAGFETKLIADFVHYFSLSLPSDSLTRLPKYELMQLVLEHAKKAGLIPSDIEVSQVQRFIELCKADFRATRHYALHYYPGRITLFKASHELTEGSADPALGWAQWATEVAVHIVPGNHATMVYRPQVEVLAEKVRACIDQVRAVGMIRE